MEEESGEVCSSVSLIRELTNKTLNPKPTRTIQGFKICPNDEVIYDLNYVHSDKI